MLKYCLSFTLDNFVKNSKSGSDYFDFLKHNCNELVCAKFGDIYVCTHNLEHVG